MTAPKIDKWYSVPQLIATGKILLIYLLAVLALYIVGRILYPDSGRNLGDGAYSDSPR